MGTSGGRTASSDVTNIPTPGENYAASPVMVGSRRKSPRLNRQESRTTGNTKRNMKQDFRSTQEGENCAASPAMVGLRRKSPRLNRQERGTTGSTKRNTKGDFRWTQEVTMQLCRACVKLIDAGIMPKRRNKLSTDVLKILCNRPGLQGFTPHNIQVKWRNLKQYFDTYWNYLKFPDKRALARRLHRSGMKYRRLLQHKFTGEQEHCLLKAMFLVKDPSKKMYPDEKPSVEDKEPPIDDDDASVRSEDEPVPNIDMLASPVEPEHLVKDNALHSAQSSKKRKQHPNKQDDEDKEPSIDDDDQSVRCEDEPMPNIGMPALPAAPEHLVKDNVLHSALLSRKRKQHQNKQDDEDKEPPINDDDKSVRSEDEPVPNIDVPASPTAPGLLVKDNALHSA